MPTTSDLDSLLPGRVVTDPDIRAGYAVDAFPQARAIAPGEFTVVRARDRQDVVTTLRYAARHGIPVVPQGGRSSTTGSMSQGSASR